MNNVTIPAVPLAVLLLSVSSIAAQQAQLDVAPQWFEVPGGEGKALQVQWSRDSSLILTPNESHFPKLGLKASGKGAATSITALNGKESFASITAWDPGDVAAWGIWLRKGGEATVRLLLDSSAAKGNFRLQIESKTYEFAPLASKGKPSMVAEFPHNFTRSGHHLIRVENLDAVAKDTHLHALKLSGEAIAGGGVLRTRWRPAAAHARFSSTALKTGSRLWIMEMDAAPGQLGFYAPVTTPFGYYGPSWNADGTVKSSMNFSLWSYARGAAEPPVEKLSHLLAIGSPDASFSGFGHEGTGVKIRNFEPLAGRQGQRQAFALRVEPGKPYDTYFSYYFATDERRWRLFGVGRKLARKRPITHLLPGSFVEVPGPPKVQRTGPLPRRMRYRGWVSADGQAWHQLNRMSNGDIDKKTGLTYTQRGAHDGWFYLQTGGWHYHQPPAGEIHLAAAADPLPEYLHAGRAKELLSVPSSIKITRATRTVGEISIDYEIENPGKTPTVTLFHGSSEALTLEKKWDEQQRLPKPDGKRNSVKIPISNNGPAFLRLLLKNEHGQFWTWETTKLN